MTRVFQFGKTYFYISFFLLFKALYWIKSFKCHWYSLIVHSCILPRYSQADALKYVGIEREIDVVWFSHPPLFSCPQCTSLRTAAVLLCGCLDTDSSSLWEGIIVWYRNVTVMIWHQRISHYKNKTKGFIYTVYIHTYMCIYSKYIFASVLNRLCSQWSYLCYLN